MNSIRCLTRVLFVAVLAVGLARPAQAEHRVALLIGNAEYPNHELRTPHADVEALEIALARRGFRTTVVRDVDAASLAQALERFARSVPTRATALVYYSGYAVQGEKGGTSTNLLLPVDGRPGSLNTVEENLHSVRDVLALLHTKSGARLQIVLVDAAYRLSAQEGDVRFGLSRLDPLVPDSFVGLAAPPGKTIEQGTTLSPMASTLTRLLNDAMEFGEAIEEASGWSASTIENGVDFSEPASVAISSAAKLRSGTKAAAEWVNGHGMVFCWCPAAETTRGFWLGKFELTRREWGRPVPKSMSTEKNHPVDMIHPREIASYLKTLNASESKAGCLPEGWEYALPTEAEWEHACRAGTKTLFYFGEDRITLPLHANFADKSLLGWGYTEDTLDDGTAELARVGEYLANPWGLHDMYGNLWEGVDSGGDDWVARGGSWVSLATLCASSSRRIFENRRPRNFLGYRLVIREKGSLTAERSE
jgi:hypothetical protein